MGEKQRQRTQIRPSDTYDDTLAAGATLESGSTNLEGDLNALRSQLQRIIGQANWYDDPSNSLEDVGGGGGGAVDSVFGRTGVVAAAASDYDADQVDYDNATSGLTAADVQAAIDEIEARLAAAEADYVPEERTITAGAGLTGGGDLSSNRTLNVVANADGSIEVNADDIQVGILATDTQHGDRGRGSLHEVATIAEAGFMSGTDKAKLDDIETGAQVNTVDSVHGRTGDVVAASSDYDADQVDYDNVTSGLTATDVQAAIDEVEGRVETVEGDYVPEARTVTAGDGLTGGGDLSSNRTLNVVANADGSIEVNADDIQVGILATDSQHGDRGRGSLHEVATIAEAGFMSNTDKAKLDGIETGAEVNTVDSVFGRTGTVVAVASDYDADQVDYDNSTSGLTATNVQAAIDELETLTGGGGGTGDVVGPASATDNAIPRYDGVTGKLIQSSGVLLSDTAQMSQLKTLTFQEPYETVVAGAAETIDWAEGTLQRIYLTEDVTLSFDPPPGASYKGALLTLRVVQNGAGGFAITWPASCEGTEPTINPATGEGNSTVVQLLFDGTDGSPSYFFLSKGAVVEGADLWHGPYGLSYQMREDSDLLFAWRAELEMVAADSRGAVHNGDDFELSTDGIYTDVNTVGLLVDASPRQHDLTAYGTYDPVWDTDGAARSNGNPFGAVQTVTSSSPADFRACIWADSNDVYDFTQLHRDGEFTILWRGLWRELVGAPGAPGSAAIVQNAGANGPGIRLGLNSLSGSNIYFAVYDNTYTTVCSVAAAGGFDEEEIVTIAVTCTSGTDNLKLWVGVGDDDLTEVDQTTFVTGGTGAPWTSMSAFSCENGVVLSSIGLVLNGRALTETELNAWEDWADGADFSNATPILLLNSYPYIDTIQTRDNPGEVASHGNFVESSEEDFNPPSAVDEAAPTELV